jgi:hypothetical protein
VRARLEAELAPRTAVAEMIFDNILRVELELRRVSRQMQALLNATAGEYMKAALLAPECGLTIDEADRLARDWANGAATERSQARARIAELGVPEDDCLAQAMAAVASLRAGIAREASSLEERRRKLLADLGRENRRKAGPVEDAEVLDARG